MAASMTILRLQYVVFFLLSAVSSSQTGDWVFENAPGIAMEYKIHIDAGKEDCYYQNVHPGATIYVNMQVRPAGGPRAPRQQPLIVKFPSGAATGVPS